VGQLFATEIILIFLLPFLFLQNRKLLFRYPFNIIITLGFLWLFGQIVTDIVRNSSFYDFLRGWSNIAFFLMEIASIYLLMGNSSRRLLIFGMGLAFGGILPFFIYPERIPDGYEFWKFGVGYSVSLFIALTTQSNFVVRSKFFATYILLLASGLNFALEARSLAGICFAAAIYTLYQEGYKLKKPLNFNFNLKARIVSLLIIFMAGVLFLKLYGITVETGILGSNAQEKYTSQSNGMFGVLIGGRQEILVSAQAILDSPILGHGSWAKDSKYSGMLQELLNLYGYEDLRAVDYFEELDEGLIPTHSFILGSWVFAGLLGPVFWFWVLGFCQKMLLLMYKSKSKLVPLVTFLTLNLAWNIFFSPLGGEARVNSAYQIAILMFMYRHLISTSRQKPFLKLGIHGPMKSVKLY
jgi:hypothetical protein